MYRFLCELQHQDVAAGLVAWDWGPMADAPFLPRVVSGRLVLCRAHWNVTEAELRALDQTSDAGQFAAVQAWRAERRLSRYVALADLDNELVIDLDNVLSVAALAHSAPARALGAADGCSGVAAAVTGAACARCNVPRTRGELGLGGAR